MNNRFINKNLAGAVLGCSLVIAQTSAMAEYRDAINLSSLKVASAQTSLTLDITQAGDRLVSVGERGHVLTSDDGGQSWSQADVPTRMQLNASQFVSASTGFAVGEDEIIIKTTDAGTSWTQQHHGREAEQPGPLLDLLFTDANNGYAVGVFNKLMRTHDAGATWHNWQAHIDNLDEWHLIAMAATGEHSDTLYITSEMGLLFRSTDGGEHFESLQTDHDGSFHGILARRNASGVDQLVLLGVGGILYTSLDGGESWQELETGTEAGLAGATWLDDGSALIVGADGVVLVLNATLNQVSKHQTDSGLPLSGVLALNGSEAWVVGMGGIDRFELPQ